MIELTASTTAVSCHQVLVEHRRPCPIGDAERSAVVCTKLIQASTARPRRQHLLHAAIYWMIAVVSHYNLPDRFD
ncbi:hypothetical protein SPRG_01340 [Saprolegnia parasitica CBS 223.65]|uniref:Uncharacterized protein n=1 Tax=Saprolegnia parasitica (strain CBS 223.65) TaxID=695850 RepID=A0A067D5U1_SAPPC|nr:hypothetical protein SPRG_01340 [Saprolegnia parasitica CBS 223.65]KDO34066.1 hypothetical protein SPRG_01340 [Saprolegnia parasitica CBS 223.65]|eukprot:XP_012194950.1 hypothetical protein SPRG_01340 [Saprolegnia parasitica CBS 223.65]